MALNSIKHKWRRGESNPLPKAVLRRLLHVYSILKIKTHLSEWKSPNVPLLFFLKEEARAISFFPHPQKMEGFSFL